MAKTWVSLGPFLQNGCFAEALSLTSLSQPIYFFPMNPSQFFVQFWGYQMTLQPPAMCLVPVPAVPQSRPTSRMQVGKVHMEVS